MLTLERQDEILAILQKKNSATVEELSNELYVSGATIRRDLRDMEKQGLMIFAVALLCMSLSYFLSVKIVEKKRGLN